MIYQSATHLAKAIKEGKTTSLAETQACLDQIDQHNDQLHSIVVHNKAAALERAKMLDEALKAGNIHGPLHGVPVTVKEAFNMVGLPTTVNFPLLKNFVAQHDSIFVQRLYDAGAVIVGKTNIPMLLADSQSFGPIYPTANNPYDVSRTPGGSTGGGAAAIAAGFGTFEIGSDIGGSIRNPSHYCGLYGLKPTENGHHQGGHLPPLPDSKMGFDIMDSYGPLARTMDDIELAWSVMGQPRWDYLQMLPVQHPMENRPSLKEYKIAWYDQLGIYESGPDSKAAMDSFLKAMTIAGAACEKITIDPKLVEQMLEVWAMLFGFVAGQDSNWLIRQILKIKFGAIGKATRGNMMKHLRKGLNLRFKDFSKTLRKRQELIAEFSKIYQTYDFVASPVSYGPAFEHNHKHVPILANGKKVPYAEYCFIFVMPYNAMGSPSLAIPVHQTTKGLPVGIQVAGPHYTEPQLIHFGKLVEATGFEFRAPQL
ncbi:MAG: amidase family protein [Bacteroidota bacterium]